MTTNRRTPRNAVARYLLSDDGLMPRTMLHEALGAADAILAAIADNERHTRTLRIQAALEAKRALGLTDWRTGSAPYGWCSVGGGRLEPVDREQRVVGWLHRQRGLGFGWEELARLLNEAGTPGPQGGRWHVSSVRRVVNRGRGWVPPGADSRSGGA